MCVGHRRVRHRRFRRLCFVDMADDDDAGACGLELPQHREVPQHRSIESTCASGSCQQALRTLDGAFLTEVVRGAAGAPEASRLSWSRVDWRNANPCVNGRTHANTSLERHAAHANANVRQLEAPLARKQAESKPCDPYLYCTAHSLQQECAECRYHPDRATARAEKHNAAASNC